MAAGRKPIAPKNEQEPVILEGEFSTAMAVMRDDVKAMTLEESQHHAMVRAVAAQIGYQLPGDCTDPDMIQRDIAINARRTAEALQQVGLGLICLKEACQHGEFRARLEVLRFEPTVASRYMKVARKFSNVATSQHLLKAIDNQSKLLEMIVLDDEQLEELALTGETGELKLDDVVNMSVKELRAKVRELRNEVTAKEDVLKTRSTQINTLEEKLSRVKSAPPDQVLAELQTEATKWLNDTRGAVIGKFTGSLEALASHYIEHGGESITVFMAGMVGQLQADLNALRDRLNIPDVTPSMIPDFVRANFGAEG
jgi:hypothetical protein